MEVFVILGLALVFAVVAFGLFALAANVGGNGMLILSLVIVLIGFAITLFSIGAVGQAEAAAPVVHKESPYLEKKEPPLDLAKLQGDPYFQLFEGIVVVVWGVAGCIGYGFAKDK
jgi:hypothetical protein